MVIGTSATGIIWRAWMGTATTTTATNDVFTYWVTDSTTTGTDTAYMYWTNEYNQLTTFRANELQRSLERQQLEQERNLRLQKEFAEKKKKELEARRKAKILLLENLDMEQFKDFQKEGFFFVKSPTGRLYRIREGRSINIDLMKGNSRSDVEKRLCGHPEIFCPNEDTMLAQKIYLEHMEQEFLCLANQYDPIRH